MSDENETTTEVEPAEDRRDHDPFAPHDDTPRTEEFRAERWRRAGATDEQVEALEAAYDALPAAAQAAQALAIDKASDGEIGQRLHEQEEAGEYSGFTPLPPAETEEAAPGANAAQSPVQEAGPINQPPVEPTTEPVEGAPPADDDGNPAPTTEEDAAKGPWTERPDLTVGGVAYKSWDLLGGFVGALVGDATTGTHLTAANDEELVERIKALLAAE
jgi:hypothetical protein